MTCLSLGALISATPAAFAGTRTWTGSAGSTDWATAANWGGTTPASADSLVFTSANASPSTTLTNTLTSASFIVAGITFNANSPAYTMTGNTFALGGSISNNSGVQQTFSNTGGIAVTVAPQFALSTSGGINITGGLANNIVGNLGITVNGLGGNLQIGGLDLASAQAEISLVPTR